MHFLLDQSHIWAAVLFSISKIIHLFQSALVKITKCVFVLLCVVLQAEAIQKTSLKISLCPNAILKSASKSIKDLVDIDTKTHELIF